MHTNTKQLNEIKNEKKTRKEKPETQKDINNIKTSRHHSTLQPFHTTSKHMSEKIKGKKQTRNRIKTAIVKNNI